MYEIQKTGYFMCVFDVCFWQLTIKLTYFTPNTEKLIQKIIFRGFLCTKWKKLRGNAYQLADREIHGRWASETGKCSSREQPGALELPVSLLLALLFLHSSSFAYRNPSYLISTPLLFLWFQISKFWHSFQKKVESLSFYTTTLGLETGLGL